MSYNFSDLLVSYNRDLKVMIRTNYPGSIWALDISDNSTKLLCDLPTSMYWYVEVIP